MYVHVKLPITCTKLDDTSLICLSLQGFYSDKNIWTPEGLYFLTPLLNSTQENLSIT